jgi:hypothetical protein
LGVKEFGLSKNGNTQNAKMLSIERLPYQMGRFHGISRSVGSLESASNINEGKWKKGITRDVDKRVINVQITFRFLIKHGYTVEEHQMYIYFYYKQYNMIIPVMSNYIIPVRFFCKWRSRGKVNGRKKTRYNKAGSKKIVLWCFGFFFTDQPKLWLPHIFTTLFFQVCLIRICYHNFIFQKFIDSKFQVLSQLFILLACTFFWYHIRIPRGPFPKVFRTAAGLRGKVRLFKPQSWSLFAKNCDFPRKIGKISKSWKCFSAS